MNTVKNRRIGMWISAAAIVLQVIMLFIGSSVNPFTKYLGIAAGILAAACSFIYLYKGGTKDAAIWNKLFCCLFMVSLLLSFIRNIQTGKGALNSFCTLLMAVVIGYIAFVKNLGRNNSFVFAGLIAVLQILTILSLLTGGGRVMVKLLGVIANTLLALLMIANTYAKYEDKKARKGIDSDK